MEFAFDEDFYIRSNPGLVNRDTYKLDCMECSSGLKHFMRDGRKDGLAHIWVPMIPDHRSKYLDHLRRLGLDNYTAAKFAPYTQSTIARRDISALLENGYVFDEGFYLDTHSDIRQAVEHGELQSGFAHFSASGRNEVRWHRWRFGG